MSLRTPLEIGFGEFMGRYYDGLVADTPSMNEYIVRGLPTSIVWVPGRMVDKVQDMLDEWRKNANDSGPGMSSFLPVILVAFAKDFTPAPPEIGRSFGDAFYVQFPEDPHERVFKVRVAANEYRAQLVFLAADGPTAHSLAMQFSLFLGATVDRRFVHRHTFADLVHEYKATIESADLGAINMDGEQKNLTILVADLVVRADIPLFQAPKPGEPNDGKPAPSGYPVVTNVKAKPAVGGGSESFLDADGKPISEFK